MDEDSALQVAKHQDEMETDEINNLPFKPSETEVICWFRNVEEGLQREWQKFRSDMSGPVKDREREGMPDFQVELEKAEHAGANLAEVLGL